MYPTATSNRGNGRKPAWRSLLGRAMLGQTVVAAIIYGFVGTD